jgi:F0F1-type ATP synthase epsilon subunit
MPHHEERPASVLARGAAKPDDIESARRGTVEARASEESHAREAIGEIETACETLREELGALERMVAAERS